MLTKKNFKNRLHYSMAVLLLQYKLKREKDMSKFNVTVTGPNYNKTFFNCAYKTKLIAMKAVIDLVRNIGDVKGELTATAKVVR